MDKQAEGRYANCFEIGHNAFEFVIDCGQSYPDTTVANYHTRIVTNPVYAKALVNVLSGALDRYREQFGEIVDLDDSGSLSC